MSRRIAPLVPQRTDGSAPPPVAGSDPGRQAVGGRRGGVLQLTLGLWVLLGLTGWLAGAQPVWAANPPAVQTYYVPLPENQLLAMFQATNLSTDSTASSSPITSNISISPIANATVIYYDHWEDGYENDITDPVQTTTQIWGDGKVSNGARPGVTTDAGDVIDSGDVFILTNNVATTTSAVTVTSPYQFNGRDKIAASKTIAVSRVNWAAGSLTNMTQATVVYDTLNWGTDFRSPVGQDSTNSYLMFKYSAFAIMSGKGGATVNVDWDNNGTNDYTVTLAEGQSYVTPIGTAGATSLKVGARVTADRPVQVNLLTGDIENSQYKESRDAGLLPVSLWSSSYVTPVSTETSSSSTTASTRIWLYNPGASALTVTYANRGTGGTGAISSPTVSVPAGGSASVTIPAGTGARLSAAGNFYAFSTTDSAATGVTAGNTANSSYDWGYAVNPVNTLTSQFLVGFAKGKNPNDTAATENSAPVWATLTGNGETAVTVYVDLKADGLGALTDPNGNQYDRSYSLKELQQAKIYDNTTPAASQDQTGMLVYVLPGVGGTPAATKLSGAWGEDPKTASLASPGLDAGTGMVPTPLFDIGKSSTLVVDADGNGEISPGDTIGYDIRVNNIGRATVPDLKLVDNLPADTTYVPNSTAYSLNGGAATAIPDAAGALPLSGAGYTFAASIPVGGYLDVSFRVLIDSVANLSAGRSSIDNTATGTASGISASASDLRALLSVVDHSYQTFVNVAISGNTSTRDIYPPASTFSSTSTPAHGAISSFNASTGTYIYTPATGYTGTDSFTYQVCMPAPQQTTCATATEYITIVNGTPVTLSGTVFNDLDASKVQNGAEVGTNASGALYVTATNVLTGQTIASVAVAANGTYSLPVAQNITYSLVLADSLNSTVPALPSGWATTGENQSGTIDAAANGTITVAVVTSNVTGQNFGIRQVLADLAVAKTDGVTSVTAGGSTSYTITVTNDGPSAVTGATDTDTAPAGLTFGAWTCAVTTPGSGDVTTACGAASGSGNLATTVTMNSGAVITYTVAATVAGGASGSLANTVTVTPPPGTSDLTPGNDSATDTDTVTPVADLAISKTDGLTSVNAGGVTTYTITITNNGPSAVTAAAVTDTAPAGLTFGAWTCAVTSAGSGGVTTACGAASGSGNLATSVTMNSGAVITYTVAATVAGSATGSLTNTATVAPPGGTTDPTPANDSASDTDTVTPVADLAISKTDGLTSVTAGGSTTYTVAVTNNGPSEVTAATVTDTAPAGLTFGAWTCAVTNVGSGGGVTTACGAASGSGNLATTVTMKPGAVITYSIAAAVASTASGGLTNTATVAPPVGTTDPTPGNDSASDTDTVIPAGAIGNLVWYDTNQDGIQDPSEPGLAGVTVRLYASGGTVPLQVTTTDGNGLYRFDGLASGDYRVQFAPPTGPGYVASPLGQGTGALAGSFDSNAGGALFEAAVTITTGADLSIDAGFFVAGVAPARIGDRVWSDTDQDGTQDGGEPGLGGVTVSLYADADKNGTPDGAALATVVSAANGDYAFAGLPAGDYVLGFGLPSGYTRSPADAGGDDATDSDVLVGTGYTASIPLAAGQDLTTVDAGYSLTTGSPASIGDFVWYDSNFDGIQDGEPGIPGVEVRLYDAAGTLLIATARTDTSGAYAFNGLAAGTYTVAFMRPGTGYAYSPSGAGTVATGSDPDPVTGRLQVAVTDGQTRTDIDAGLYVPGQAPISLGDFVWQDLDADGLPDADEGLAGADVVLYDSLGQELARLTTTATTTTATNYSFPGLPAGGSYRVAVDTSTVAGLAQLADPDATLDDRHDLIGPTASTTLVDFGYLAPAPSVSITKTASDGSDSQQLLSGGTAGFKLTVTNTGNLTLTNLTVADPLAPTCAHTIASLAPGASSTAVSCTQAPVSADFTNSATVTAQPVDAGNQPFGATVSDDDSSAVDVINPAITIVKTATNSPVTSGGTATFGIVVTNTGDVPLTDVAVVDPLAASCAKTIGALAIGASDSYDCSLDNVTAPFFNVATVNATTPLGATLSVADDAYVNVVTPGLSIYKAPDSQTIRTGGTATFNIRVTNTGDVALPTVSVSDPNTPDCNRANVGPLAAGAHFDYSCTATNVSTSFSNTITATAGALEVTDVAEIVVINPSIAIVKTTNGAEGQQLRSGFFVHWTYLVTNTGDGPLTNVGVTDDQGVTVTCPKTTLAVAEAMTCHGYGMSILGAYANTGTATGTAPDNLPVTGTDPSGYTGVNPAVIGNRVWLDENGDGAQDAGEAGIANLKVELLDGSTVVKTTYTDSLGGYLFTEVIPGSYTVRVTPTAGLNPTWNEDTGTTAPDGESAVTVTAGADHLTADFGYNWVPPTDSTNPGAATTGAIGDRIWNDSDGDGLQDAGEAGIAGVTVTLTGAGADGIFGNGDDPTQVVTTTDAAGNYIFDGLPKGSYRVTVTPPGAGWTQTGDPDGVPDNLTTTPIVLAPGDVYVNADFGYRPATGSSIGDTIWFDANPDGVQNPGELGIPGVTVALLSGADVIATTVTDGAGQYLFAGLPAGSYTVAVTDTDHLLDAQLSHDPDATKDARTAVTVDGTNSVLTADFGYAPLNQQPGDGLIGDFVFIDRDGNGQPGPGEGVQGVRVELWNATGTSKLAETWTNPVGVYGFGGLDVTQTYVVKVATATLPNGGTGMVNTLDPDTVGTGDNQSLVANLATAGQNLLQDFGYRVTTDPAAIGGLLWEDADADGVHVHAAGIHRHLAGVTVALYGANGNLVGTTVTDSNGEYLFAGLSPGSYTVDVTDTANLLDGWWHSLGDQSAASDDTSKADPFTLTVTAGQTNTNVDFGYYNAGAALGNRVWLDTDGDGIQDLTETTGLAGAAVELVITWPNSAGTTTLVTTTDAHGGYRFGNLLLDESFDGTGGGEPTYAIRIATPPSGYVAGLIGQGGNALTDGDDPAGTPATVLKGQTDTALAADPATEPTNAGYDFAYTGAATVTGHLYIDSDGDGQQDPGEPDLVGVDVVITDRNGATWRVTSDANGNYSSAAVAPNGIPAGSASVNVDEADPQYPTGYTQTEGSDPTAITVPNSGSIDAGNDGYQAPSGSEGTVTGHLFIDSNRDGDQDTGEPNLAGVDVLITDRFGATQTVTSNASGNYSATVPAGNTTADVVDSDPQIPAGYEHTAGTDPNSVTAVAGATTDIGTDGYGPPTATLGAVTGRVYLDTNGNGLQDPGEPGIANLDVLVTDKDGSVRRVTTDAGGDYTASGLPAGQVSVALDGSDPQYPTGLTQTEGLDPTTTTVVATQTADAGRDGFHAATASIGDRVWLDEDGDGVQDPGEAGIANLTVELYRDDQNPGTDTPLATTRTNSDGGYLFADVPAGTGWQVRVIPATGLQPTADEDGIASANLSAVPTLAAGAMYLSADFGYNWVSPDDSTAPTSGSTGAIGDRVWSDANGNGRQDPGEPGLGGVTVAIYIDSDANGTFDALYTAAIDQAGATGGTTTTTTDGSYVFRGLPAGAYEVRVTTPAGYSQTGDPDQPGVPCTGCDARTTSPVVLAPGDVWVNADFGYRPTDVYAVSGSVYLDPNANGVRLNEPGIPGVTVNLVGASNTVLATATTDANGNYSFPGVAPGSYTVVVGDTADLLALLTQSGDPDAALDNQTEVAVTDASVTGLDFGYVPAYHESGDGLIGDTLFLDRDGDNAFDAGEGLAGVTVQIYAAGGTTLLGSAVTDANGNYWFGALDPAATYLVRVVSGTLPAGVANTVDPEGTPGDGESSRNLTVLGPIDLAADFGYRAQTPNTIGGTLWRDSNADGLLTEAGIFTAVTVELRDLSGAVVGTTVTDANGEYSFAGLPDGTYSVHVTDTANLLNGWWKSTGPSAGVDNNSQADPYSVVVAGGVTNTSGDFGYYLVGAALGNRAWVDSDNDGLQDAGETTGPANVPVTLLITYPNGTTTSLVTQTDADGVYRFANLLLDEGFRVSTTDAGSGPSYRVSAASAPTGYVAGSKLGLGDGKNDSDPHSGVTAAAIVQGDLDTALNAANPSAETNNAAYDFAYVPEGSLYGISGTVYNDVNGNGNLAERTGFGGTETALTGVSITVTLYTDPNGDGDPADGVAVGSPVVTTDGTYSFTGLAADNYVVVETNPSGYVSTNDVDAPNNDRIAVVLTTASATAQDFLDTQTANSQLGSIAGQVRDDQNGDGNLATGTDPGLPNVTVELWIDSDSNGTPDSLYDTDTTDGSGNYSFAGVPPGDYVVVEVNLGGYASTNDVTAPNDDRIPLTLPNQGALTGRDFLDSQSPNLGSIAGTVLLDSVGAGNFANASGGLSGATVTLWTDPNGDGNPVDGVVYGSQTTGSPGTYAFTGLPVGSYVVVETNPSGYTSTNDVTAPNDDRIPVTLPAGTNVIDRNFLDAANGSAQVAAISGRVVDDTDGDGDLNERGTETGINGVTVTLYTDPNGDGDPSDGVLYSTSTTSGNGNYSFPAVPPGDYVLVETDPNGYSSTNDVVGPNDNQVPVNRTGTTPVINADFLDSQTPDLAAIGNRVWLDENSNGVQDAGEYGIANVTVELVDANDAVIATTVTDADGGYLFIGVAAGQYSVEIDTASLAVGLQPIADEDDPISGTLPPATPSVSVVTVVGGAEHLSADFGYNWVTRALTTTPPVDALGAIGDRVWDDANGNGTQEPGEAGLGNVSVRLLTDDNGDGVYGGPGDNAATTATTNASGNYIFTGLPANAYVVEVQTLTLPNGPTWTQTGDPDGPTSTDSRTTTPVILAPGDVFVNADFGYRPSLGYTIGDRIYLDTNADGVDDGQTLEPGIAGVTIALSDAGGDVIATTVTDEYGEYAFAGLPAGTYSVVVTDTDHVVAELVLSGDPQGPLDGQSTVVLTNADNPDQDFGFAPPGQVPGAGLIGDTIFLDRNASGVAEAGEGLEGVTVRLYAANGTTLLATRVTSEDGTYAFGGLSPTATYVVRVDTTTLPNGGTGLTNTVDPDGGATSQAVRNLASTGPIDLAADFGYRPLTTPNSITGMVWKDPNADGTRQSGETVRFGGVTVELRDANGNRVGTTVTAPNGTYSFANLPDGTYSVDLVDPDGVLTGYWHSLGTNSQPDPATITVNDTLGRDQVADFGYYLDGAALGNRVWKDANGDGIQQTTETVGLGGTLLKLVITYPNGAVSTVYTQSSATDGGYGFGDLLLDENFTGSGTGQPTYVLSVVTAPPGHLPSPINQGGYAATDSNNPSGTAATVVKGQTAVAVLANPNSESANATFDFGYIPAATSCTLICDVYPQTGGDGVVDMRDLTWINARVKTKVTPAGAPHSGDCAKDGKLMVNDITACQAYLSP